MTNTLRKSMNPLYSPCNGLKGDITALLEWEYDKKVVMPLKQRNRNFLGSLFISISEDIIIQKVKGHNSWLLTLDQAVNQRFLWAGRTWVNKQKQSRCLSEVVGVMKWYMQMLCEGPIHLESERPWDCRPTAASVCVLPAEKRKKC